MKRLIPLLLVVVMVFPLTAVHAQKKKRLAFEKSDLLFYLKSGYPKVPEESLLAMGNTSTMIPPVGLGFQYSIIDYLSFGPEFIFTYQNPLFTYEDPDSATETISMRYRKSFLMMGSKIFVHYPFRFFDLYLGGGGGYTWVRHETLYISDYSFFYWNATFGFRIAFGGGSPFGIFTETSLPYPLVAAGLYYRFRVY